MTATIIGSESGLLLLAAILLMLTLGLAGALLAAIRNDGAGPQATARPATARPATARPATARPATVNRPGSSRRS